MNLFWFYCKCVFNELTYFLTYLLPLKPSVLHTVRATDLAEDSDEIVKGLSGDEVRPMQSVNLQI